MDNANERLPLLPIGREEDYEELGRMLRGEGNLARVAIDAAFHAILNGEDPVLGGALAMLVERVRRDQQRLKLHEIDAHYCRNALKAASEGPPEEAQQTAAAGLKASDERRRLWI